MSSAKDFVQRIINQLSGKDKQPDKVPLRTALRRNERFTKGMQIWREARSAEQLRLVGQRYTQALAGNKNQGVHCYVSPQANGFYFNHTLPIPLGDFAFLLDYFRDQVVTAGYRLYTSDKLYRELPTGIQCTDRYYLKPIPNHSTQPASPIDQRYGNVHLELVSVDDAVHYLKVMAQVYHDRNYLEAAPFKSLVEQLVGGA